MGIIDNDAKYIMYPWAVSGYDDNNLVSILVCDVLDQLIPNSACSATDISWNIEILLLASFDIIHNKSADQTTQMHRLVCILLIIHPRRQIFSYL